MTEKDLQIQDLRTENEKLKRQMKELTENSLDPIEMCKVKIALDRLKEYEERSSLLLEVGDKVFQVDSAGNVFESRITKIIYDTNGIAFEKSAIGETVFLTEQEAQAALEKMKGE